MVKKKNAHDIIWYHSLKYCVTNPVSHVIMFVNEKFLINFVLLGGKVVVPENAEENKAVAHLASKFNQSCCADEQGGKTIWIGIKPDNSGQWKVSWKQWKLT